jgi:hypothetical protein
MAAMLSSALPELSIETKFTDFLPAPGTVFNVALAFTFFVAIQHTSINPLTLAVNAFGDLFSSTKPKEILVQVSRVSTPTVKVPPTPTVEYRYQPESTSNILYVVALWAIFVLVGAIIIVLRKRSTASSSSVNPRFDIGSARHSRRSSDNLNASSSLCDIPGHFGSRLMNPADDNSDKNAPGFLEKLKTFFILFFILTAFTHGGRITQKIRSLAIRDDFPFSSDIPITTLEPYFHQASELVTTTAAARFDDFPASFSGGNILVAEVVETLTFNILYSSTPSSTLPSPSISSPRLSSGPDEKYDSISLLPIPTMTSNPTSAYPIGLSLVATTLSPNTPSPTTTSSSKAALDKAFEYIKFFILFLFCILIPILSFLMTVLPAYSDYIQLSRAISADQREVISIHFSSHELLLIKFSAESCYEIHSQCQRGCSHDRGR